MGLLDELLSLFFQSPSKQYGTLSVTVRGEEVKSHGEHPPSLKLRRDKEGGTGGRRRRTTETLRQVPQSCGIPSHDRTQGDRPGDRRGLPRRRRRGVCHRSTACGVSSDSAPSDSAFGRVKRCGRAPKVFG